MRGVFVRTSDGKVMASIEVPDQQSVDASKPSGCDFVADLDVDRKRIPYAFYSDGNLTYTKTEAELNVLEQWTLLRQTRDELLRNSDFTQSPDSPLSDSEKTEWAEYRTLLRNLPENTSDPANPSWPDQPS